MMTLIIGGSGSGKSAFAEQYAISCAKEKKKYYLATMKIYDEEGRKKVERHRMQRLGKGFQTIEQPTDIENAVREIQEDQVVVLLECISNLVANEMFSGAFPEKSDVVVQKVMDGMQSLKEQVDHLVIVTNNVFEDGTEYDPAIMEYLNTLGAVNRRLAAMSEKVVEVVVGIPVILKGER